MSVPLVPEESFLLGCVFAIADYPEQMSDKQLLATWKRVSWGSRLARSCVLDWVGWPPAWLASCNSVHVCTLVGRDGCPHQCCLHGRCPSCSVLLILRYHMECWASWFLKFLQG